MDKKFKEVKQRNHCREWIKRLKNYYKSVYICPYKASYRLLDEALKFVKNLINSKASATPHNATIWKTLISLSTYTLPYPSSVTNGWTVPSLYLEYKVVNRYREYEKAFPQSKIDGSTNLWIMKPSFSSRGIGIHCFKDIKEVYARGRKAQAKVVQKYVENPFLLLLPGPYGKLEKRKFDIRQWVLVTSMNPLVIYMFSSCYLKICGSEFSLDDIKDNYKHLSNYSVQRYNNRIQDIRNDLVMSLPQFLQHLKKHHNIELSWENTIFPKLAGIVKNTIYSACDVVEHRANSFELYGFDFVLDEGLNPWLIEVNSSPACCERTDWLVEMLSKIS